MAKKKREESGGYNYMDTYGDLVTLLLTFFVLLYSFSSTDQAKFKQLIETISGTQPSTAINVELTPLSVGFAEVEATILENEDSVLDENMEGQGQQQGDVQQDFNELYYSISNYIDDNSLNSALSAQKDGDEIVINILDGILFDSGSAQIKQENVLVLDSIGSLIKQHEPSIGNVQIEGHTDNVPISTAEFQDNWDLSNKRASNVVRYIHAAFDVSPDLLSSAGYGEFRPVDTNTTEEGRQNNRRIRMIITRIESGDQE